MKQKENEMTTLPRGIRNNNPGNIRWGSNWNGLDEEGKKKDKEFCVFVGPTFGIRALARLLMNYHRIYGINTIRGIINRYSPSNENNTEAYINHVSKLMGIDADEKINVYDENVIRPLVKAIIQHENGVMPYSDEVINEGLSFAGITVR